MKTISWHKVRHFVKTRKPLEVDAGILEYWYWTAATVYEDGKWLDKSRAWTKSTWGTPGIKALMPIVRHLFYIGYVFF